MKLEQPGQNIQINAQELLNQISIQRNQALDALAALECYVKTLQAELKSIKGNGHGVVLHKEVDDAGHPTV